MKYFSLKNVDTLHIAVRDTDKTDAKDLYDKDKIWFSKEFVRNILPRTSFLPPQLLFQRHLAHIGNVSYKHKPPKGSFETTSDDVI